MCKPYDLPDIKFGESCGFLSEMIYSLGLK